MMKINNNQLNMLAIGQNPRFVFTEWDKENDFENLIVSLSTELLQYRLEKLPSCPFCGSVTLNTVQGFSTFLIQCGECSAEANIEDWKNRK